MSAVTLHYPGIQDHYQAFPVSKIPENSSFFLKMMTAIPIIGDITFTIISSSLNERMASATNNLPALVELIEIKNSFITATAVGNLIFVAIMASSIALGIMSGVAISQFIISGLCTVILAVDAVSSIRNIIHNRGIIDELCMTGFRHGMIVR